MGGGYTKTGGVYVRQRSKVLRLQQTEQEPKTQIEIKRTNGKAGTGGEKKMKNKLGIKDSKEKIKKGKSKTGKQ